jgi:hypothetical protein
VTPSGEEAGVAQGEEPVAPHRVVILSRAGKKQGVAEGEEPVASYPAQPLSGQTATLKHRPAACAITEVEWA